MRKKKKPKITKVLIVLASFYIGYILISTQITMTRLKKEVDVRQQELSKLEDKNQKLQDEVNNMINNPDAYTEKLARERLGLVKPGEAPVVDKK
jgi:cell division protein FtsB